MDTIARSRLVAEIAQQAKAGGEMAVPLDLFFRGNDDAASIGVNLGPEQPPISTFYTVLQALRAKPGVQDIWVRVYEVTDETVWPFTDTIYVIASIPQIEIAAALAPLRCAEVVAEWMYGKPAAAPEPRAGATPFTVWWD